VRMGKWKGVRTQLRKNPDAKLELYDLDADPGETMEIAADHPEVVASIEKVMRQQHLADPNWKFPMDLNPDKE